MPDSLSCFTYLCDNVPLWMASLDDIDRQIERNQKEAARVPVAATSSPQDGESGKSVRVKVDGAHKQTGADIMSAPQLEDINNTRGVLQQEAQLARRKRKTASGLSENASGSCKYRSRGTVVVYYNSDIQKAFEILVRNIGLGRSYIRKDMMAAKMDTMAHTGDSDDDIEEMMLVKGRYKRTSGFRSTRSGMSVSSAPNDVTTIMEIANKALDKAQSLCERAAHQFLRDGDCSMELDGAKEHFQEVTEISRREASRLREKQTQAQAQPQARPPPNKPSKASEITEIELDDRADNGLDLPLSPIRLTART